MAQKQYGIIPHDTSQVGYGQDTPVVDHEAMKKRMVAKLEADRKKKKKKEGVVQDVKGTVENIRKRQEATDDAAK